MTLNMELNLYLTTKPGAVTVKKLLAKIKNDGI
jgi:hypothetical protein